MPSTIRGKVELQPRDIQLFLGLFESRLMTLNHISTLYFDDKKSMAKKRIQKLKTATFIRERPRGFADPSILSLTRKSFRLLQTEGLLANFPRITQSKFDRRTDVSELTLKHELAVMDVKTAIVKAIKAKSTFEILESSTWPALYEFESYGPSGDWSTTQSDGLIIARERREDGSTLGHVCFLEVDRSTEPLKVLCERAQRYLEYYRGGGFARRCGIRGEEYKKLPFRVLWICQTGLRRDNLAKRLLEMNPPILTQACLGTFDQIAVDPLGLGWTRPVDFRKTDVVREEVTWQPLYESIKEFFKNNPTWNWNESDSGLSP